MLVKLLGAIDLVSGLILMFGAGLKIPYFILLPLGIILLIKASLGILKDIASWIDALCGLIMLILIIINIPWIIMIILGIAIIQKGIFSFL